MIISLNDDYRIESADNYNWIFQERKERKDSKEVYYKNVYYFGTLASALQSALNDPRVCLKMKDRKEHIQWIEKIKDIYDKLEAGHEREKVQQFKI